MTKISSIRRFSVIAAIASAALGVFAPGAYYMTISRYIQGSIDAEITLASRSIEALIANNPDSWQFEDLRIRELLNSKLDKNDVETRTIRSVNGHVIVRLEEPIGRFFVQSSQPLYFSGEPVGSLEISRSTSVLARNTVIAAGNSILFSLALFILFWSFPLRTLKAAYHKVEDNERRLTFALASGNFGVWDWDLDRNTMLWNERMYEIYGSSPDNDQNLLDVWCEAIHSEERGAALERIHENGFENGTWSDSFRIMRTDGSERYISYNAMGVQDNRGKASRIVGLCNDITERVCEQEALRKSEERYRLIFNNTATANIVFGEDKIVRMVNENFCVLMGYSKEDIEGKMSWETFIHKDDLPRMQGFHKLRRIASGSAPVSYEFRGITRAGDVIDLFICVMLLPETLESVVSIMDLTERKKLEKQLLHAQKMEAVGTLSGGIAHDFNNILMGIQGYVSLMMLDVPEDNAHYESLKLIEEQVETASRLTTQLLGFARGGKYEVKPLNINELIEQTSGTFGRTKKDVVISCEYQHNVWTVAGDQTQIEQVLLNLYLNAWQAMPNGGNLILESANVRLNEAYTSQHSIAPGKYVRISVKDTGVGMDEQTKERIFEPFFTTKELKRGSGLGLAMVYGIVKNHNGHIEVESEIGKGTSFIIYLPAIQDQKQEETRMMTDIKRGSETVLIVDDEPHVLQVSKKILEALGYRVFEAAGGEKGIALYRDKKDEIDLVVLDMIMPGLSGSDTFNLLKKINPEARIVLSSGYSLDGQAQEIMDKGCQGFIQKPFNVKSISVKLRDVLDSTGK